MMTIKNINKLNNKTLGKKNFYVEKIEEQFSIDGHTYSACEHKYKITITNRKYSITITLERDGLELNGIDVYILRSSNGNKLYILKDEIRNMDKFIDRLRYVALSKFK